MRAALLVLLLLPLTASAAQQFRSLITQAIDAPDGKASAYIEGEEALRLQRGLKTQAPVLAEVTTVARYQQAGCRRLNVKFSIPGELFKTTDGRMMPFVTGFRMNACRDGSPPMDQRTTQ